jgi:hypothetical protein
MMKLSIPNSWQNISIEKFPLIFDVIRDDLDDNEKNIRILSILSDVNVNEIKKINIEGIKKLIDKIQFVFKMEFPKEKHKFKHNGFNWVVNYDITKISAGDFISLSKLTENEDAIINNLPQIVAVFIQPFRYKWFRVDAIEMDYTAKVNHLKSVDVGTIYPIAVFFCSIIGSLSIDIEDYLEKQTHEVKKILMNELNSKSTMNTGDGT